jgi:sarcosine oxidase subunit gamma
MTSPLSFARRTPLRRLAEAEGLRWRPLADAALADGGTGASQAPELAIIDLTPLPRLGFKGRGTIEAMKKRAIVVEATPNRAFRQPDGGLCLVLAPGEVILLSNLSGEGRRLDEMHASWRIEDEERTYPLLRRDSHAWLAVSGDDAPAMFAKLCAIDMRRDRFSDLAIAQTSLAKMSAIVVRADLNGRPLYHLLADSASALYLCKCLVDAAREFGGRITGSSAVQDAEAHGKAEGPV